MATIAIHRTQAKHPQARPAWLRCLLVMIHCGRFRPGDRSPCCRGERLKIDPKFTNHVGCRAGGELYPRSA